VPLVVLIVVVRSVTVAVLVNIASVTDDRCATSMNVGASITSEPMASIASAGGMLMHSRSSG
jgi:hypothetical protein